MRNTVQPPILLLMVAGYLLAGCAATQYVMKNPRTGQVLICQGDANEWLPSRARTSQRCAEALERDGWVRFGDDGHD